MSIRKSIIEDMELKSGTQIYVQSSGTGNDVALSFDGSESSFGIRLTVEETTKYVELLSKVLEEIKDAN